MKKGIHLNVLVEVEGSPMSQTAKDEIRLAVDQAVHSGTPSANLTGEVKRARLKEDSDEEVVWLDLLIYLTGEQDASQNFARLATAECAALLDAVSQRLGQKGIRVTLHSMTENTNAIDELADEALDDDKDD